MCFLRTVVLQISEIMKGEINHYSLCFICFICGHLCTLLDGQEYYKHLNLYSQNEFAPLKIIENSHNQKKINK